MAERVKELNRLLDRLWNLHRCEVAMLVRYHEEPTDRLGSEWFVDFCTLTHMRAATKWRVPRIQVDAPDDAEALRLAA